MRIFIIHNYYQHTGGEDIVFQQEKDKLSEQFAVGSFTVRNKRGMKGIWHYLLYPWNWMEASQVLKAIKDFRPDVIHIHNIHYSLGPLFIRRISNTGLPIVMTLHNFRLICPSATLFNKGRIFLNSLEETFPWTAVREKALENSWFKTLWTAWVYWFHHRIGTFAMIDRYIVLSEFSKQTFLMSKFELSAAKLTVKPNFVSSAPRASSKERGEDFVYIGRLSEEKGIIPLLKTWITTPYSLKIFGTGPLKQEVEQIIANYPNIQYFGFQDHQVLNSHLVNASALIVPSVCYESMPLAVLQAFSLGTPVICSNIGILPEMVLPLYTGLVFDPHHPKDLSDKLAKWSKLEPEQMIKIKQNCRKEYIKKYESDKVMNTLVDIYEETIHKKKKQ